MPACLVLGASGQIGRFLVPRLLAAGEEVHALSRQPRAGHDRLHWLPGDLYADAPLLPAVETIYSLGPLDGLAAWLARVPVGAATRLIASGPIATRLIAFGSMSLSSKRDSPDPTERALAARLLAAEQAVAASAERLGLSCTVLRPTLIYGAGLDRSLTPLAHFATRWRVFPRIPGACGLRQPVHAEDLADAAWRAARSDAARGRTYELGGGERLPFAELLARVHAALPRRAVPVPLPLPALRGALALARALHATAAGPTALARLRADLVADDTPARADLGWAPRAFRPTPACWVARPLP